MQLKTKSAISGRFHFVQHDCRGLKGSGPNGEVQFEDLFKKENGVYQSRHPNHVKLDMNSKNKVLRRGISHMLYQWTKGQGALNVPEVTYSPTSYPFQAIILVADKSGSPSYDADTPVTWDESDSQYNTKIPPGPAPHPIGEGRRGITHSDTSGPGLKRVDIYYPTQSPYREIEYILFAQANVPNYATGSITTVAVANLIDGETFTLDDGLHDPVVFEFDTNATVTPGNIAVDISSITTADEVRDEIIWTVNNAVGDWQLGITASDGGSATVTLTHDTGGAVGDVAITHTVADGGWAVSGMSGGSALEVNDDYIDNYRFEAIGMANGVAAGDGEANSLWGSRSIIGLAPTWQGKIYRDYYHQHATPSSLHLYETGHTVGTYGEGYVETTHDEETIRTVATDTRDQIWASGSRIRMANLNATQSDVGRSIDIAGSGAGNDGRKTIATVESPIEVTVNETTFDESNGFTATLIDPGEGWRAFDGVPTSEGDSSDPNFGTVTIGDRWRSGTSPSHMIGRIWDTGKIITGFRIVIPEGLSLINTPDDFEAEYLPNTGGTAQPYDDTWTTTGDVWTGQANNIFNAGRYGYEFQLSAATPSCLGFRLNNITAATATEWTKIAQLYIYGVTSNRTAFSDKYLIFRVNGGPWRTIQIPDQVSDWGISDMVDSINSVVRGYGIEAVRSELNYLWLRGTVAGSNATVELESEANGSTVNSELGFPSGGGVQTGVTQSVMKLPTDALTIMYRINISGDLPQP